MSSSTFEVREPESEKVLEFELDTCEENGLEVSTNIDGEVPKDHTYTKEPDVEAKSESKHSDSEETSADTMEVASPKKRSGRPSKANKKDTNSSKGTAKKDVKGTPKKEPVTKKGKKKEISANENNTTVKETVSDEDKETKVESEPTEEAPRQTKRGKKRKIEEKENVIDQSIMDEVQNITEDPAAVNETSTESPPKKKKAAKEEKSPKAKKPVKPKDDASGDVIEDRTNLPKGWLKKLVVRKSGKTAGIVDVYIYSPEGLKFRSKPDVASYLLRTKSSLTVDDFDFSKKKMEGYTPKSPAKTKSSPSKAKEAMKKKASTPKKSSKLVVKIAASKKKKNNKTTKGQKGEEKQSKSTVKEEKAKTTKPKGKKKKNA